MKKLLLIIILMFPFCVKADTCNSSNISISNISLLEKSDNVNEVIDATVKDKDINIDLTMFQVGDKAKYKVELKNDSNEDYEIDRNSLSSISDYFEYSFESEDNSNVIKANSSKTLYLNVKYNNKVPDDIFLTPVYNDVNTMVVGLSAESTNGIQKILENPKTGVYSYAFVLFIIVPIGVISYILIKKKKYSKFMMIVVISLLVIPYVAFAKCKCDLNINTNISVSKREPFLYYYYIRNNKVRIEKYLIDLAQTNIEFTLNDKNKCINYFNDVLADQYDSDGERYIGTVDRYDIDEAYFYASSICSGGSDKYDMTLENYVYDMNEDEYSLAGISNVRLTSKGTDVGKDVVIPSYLQGFPVTIIGNDAFYDMGINSVVLPEKLEEIDGSDEIGAFGKNNLTSITFPNTLEKIGVRSFTSNNLTSVVIPDSVKVIEADAFWYNDISYLDLGNGVEQIEYAAFSDNNLTELTIPASVKMIEAKPYSYYLFNGAFDNNQLRKVYIMGKSSEADFELYRSPEQRGYVTPFGWASDVTCVKDNSNNVTNGCIIWEYDQISNP